MGPGLFVALALLAGPVEARERTVGLDARGVDPRAAVDNRWGLDVRDELGRPVEGAKVLADLKSASVARAAASAFASRVRDARAVISGLELLSRARDGLRGWTSTLLRAAAAATLPSPRPKAPAAWLVALAVAAVLAGCCPRPEPADLVALRSRQSRPEVLRC